MKFTIFIALMSLSTFALADSEEKLRALVKSEKSCNVSIEKSCEAGSIDETGRCIIKIVQKDIETNTTEEHFVSFTGSKKMNKKFAKVGTLVGEEYGIGNLIVGGLTAVVYQPFKFPSYLIAKDKAKKFYNELKSSAVVCN